MPPPKPSIYKPNTSKVADKKEKLRKAYIYLNQGYKWNQIENVLKTRKDTLMTWARKFNFKLVKEPKA